VVFLGLVLSVPVLQNLFHFAPLHGLDLALCLLAGAASILWFEILKLIRRPDASRAVTGVARA
jgi:Ca2+-transporting ATPase